MDIVPFSEAELLTLAAYVAKYGVERVLVDPAVNVAARRALRLFQRADELLGGRLPLVPERTVVAALDVVKTTDDPIVLQYVAGVFAASGEDDSGAPIVQLIGRLSSRDLRTHYVLYRELQRFIEPEAGDPRSGPERRLGTHLFIPLDEFLVSVGLEHDDAGLASAAASLRNLANERLLGQVLHNGSSGSPPELFIFGEPAAMTNWFRKIRFPGAGLLFVPSPFGETLLAWGCGVEHPSPSAYRSMVVPPMRDETIPECPSAATLDALPQVIDS